LVAGQAGGLRQVLGQRHGAAAGGDPFRVHPVPGGQLLPQLDHGHVGVAVGVGGGPGDRLHHAGQRPVRHFVAGELDRTRDGPSGYVAGKLLQVGTGQRAHRFASSWGAVGGGGAVAGTATTTVCADLSCSAWCSGRSKGMNSASMTWRTSPMPKQYHNRVGKPMVCQRRKDRPKLSGSVLSIRITLIRSNRLPGVWPVLATAGTS